MGRPTKYNEEIQERSELYVTDYEEVGDAVPSVAGLSRHLLISKKTLYNWAEKNEEFLHTLGDIESEQEKQLSAKGLKGEFNSTITKLMFHNHGYSDRTDLTSGGEKLPTPIYQIKED